MLKQSFLWVILIVSIFVFMQAKTTHVEAQSPTLIDCGSDIESIFTSDPQVHTYQVNIEAGTALVLYAQSMAGNYQTLRVDIELSTPGGNVISDWRYGTDRSYAGSSSVRNNLADRRTIRTNDLSETGTYTVRIIGFTDTGSPYRFYVSCIQSNGSVVSSSRMVNATQCGAIVENEFIWDPEVHYYYVVLQAGTSISLFVESIALSYQNLRVDIGLVTPRENIISDWRYGTDRSYAGSSSVRNNLVDRKAIETDPLPEAGIYRISVIGFTDTGSNYILQVGCTLPDGTVVNPGDAPPVDLTSPAAELPSTVASQPTFSGFGFPGVASVDFSSGIEIPLQAGQIQTVPLASDVALYTYATSAGEVATLSVTRASGDISIGVAVINQDTNEIIFLGGMPSSNNLSVELTFPTSGTYAIGLFRLDTAERSGTSGAVQLVIE